MQNRLAQGVEKDAIFSCPVTSSTGNTICENSAGMNRYPGSMAVRSHDDVHIMETYVARWWRVDLPR